MADQATHTAPESKVTSREVMLGMLQASSEACWCMEFGEPVDVTAPDAEVVRQVFENDPYWSFANLAMAQLYLMPGGEFIKRPVAEVFPRNTQNEEFVRNLIANGFEVDAAPALDTRYDGVEIEVENDVRAHIENGRLLRMFGNVRDIGKHRRRETALRAQLDIATAMLDAVPTPALAFDGSGTIVGVNIAALQVLNETGESVLGQPATLILQSADEALGLNIEALLRHPFATLEADDVVALGHRWTLATANGSDGVAGIVSALPVRGGD